MTVQCKKCLEHKDSSLFHKEPAKRNGLASHCKACRAAADRERYWREPEKKRQKSADWRALQTPERLAKMNRNSKLKKAYGLSYEEVEEMKRLQSHSCAICKVHESKVQKGLAVDHNHSTGHVRKLLCHQCNTALGLV
jgi:hypothetical protein